jgi:predicted ArsR family transcriptional regulator
MNLNLLWIRPVQTELGNEERRIREFLESPGGVSESARSLASKLEIGPRVCRTILERLVEQGVVERHEFTDMEPMYFRFPTR